MTAKTTTKTTSDTMTKPGQSRPASSRTTSISKRSASLTAPERTAGPLTKVAAKVNSQVTQISSARAAKPAVATRRNKKGLVLYVDPAISIALRRLALDTGESVQELGLNALNLLFAAHGRPQFLVVAEPQPSVRPA